MDNSIEKKLNALVTLQSIDSRLDSIFTLRGDLPNEVRDLEDEIVGYDTRIDKFNRDVEALNEEIENKKIAIKESEKLIKKYEEQQMKVRNNREYDAITKEIELQNLEIQIFEKKIREAGHSIESKKEEIEQTTSRKSEREEDFTMKKDELKSIIEESHEEESKIKVDREKASQQIEERLLNSYNKIRKNARNGLAVVSVKRDACGGCFNTVPPQRQVDIMERKKIIVCEHCGRILADVERVIEEEKPKRKTRAKSKV